MHQIATNDVRTISALRADWSDDDLQQDVSEAHWADSGLEVVAKTTVGSLVPTVFDAYARITYPTHVAQHAVASWPDQLTSIIEVLARNTSTPDDCWFAIWEGNTALDDIRDTAPTADIAGYNYFLVRGPVSRAIDTLGGLSPDLWWPADHAWCMAQHFDFPCAYLGGNTETVTDILALNGIESRPIRVDQIITAGHDENG